MVRHADPDLLVNLTNDAWFGDSTEPWIHLALAKLRAVEHRRYLVRSHQQRRLGDHRSGRPRAACTAAPSRRRRSSASPSSCARTTGYEILGDWPWYLASLAIVADGVRHARAGDEVRRHGT